MSVFWKNLPKWQNKKGGGCKPSVEKHKENFSLLIKYQPKGYLLIFSLHGILFCLYISKLQFLPPIMWLKSLLFTSIEKLKGKRSVYKWLTLYTKNTDKKPSTKFLPFGVLRLVRHTFTGGALLGRPKPPESRTDETGSTTKVLGKNLLPVFFWGSPSAV